MGKEKLNIIFVLFCFEKKATRIQNILTHSVWHFLTFVNIKIVGEPKRHTLILATNEVIESRCVQPYNSLVGKFFYGQMV